MNNFTNNASKTKIEIDGEKAVRTYEEGKKRAENFYEEGKEKAEELYAQTKEKAARMYEEGKRKIGEAQDNIHEYTEELVKNVQAKPLTSVLIAAGVGFVLSALLRK